MSPTLAAARRLAACLLALGLLVGVRSPASAHAEIVEASPAANASLIEAPSSLRITFSEPIDADTAIVALVDAEQRPVSGLGELRLSDDGRTAELSLPDIEPDVYTVSYQVVSTVDGHATAGFYAFVVDPSGAAPPPIDSATESSPSVDPLTVAARWVALVALLVALGSAITWWHAAGAVPGSRPPWRLIVGASLAAAAGIAAYLALAARPIAGSGTGTGIPFDIAAPFGWSPFAVAMRVAFVAALLAAGLAFAARHTDRSSWPIPAIGGSLALGLGGMSLAGHAAAAGPAFAAIDWLHLVAVAAWLGGLPAAVLMAASASAAVSGTWRSRLGSILRRHGRLALVAGPVVALTGIANSPVVLGSARDLVASDYGNLLVAKAGLLSVALGIGAVNHLALRGRGRAGVVALLGAELLVGALAVSAAATMVTIQPAASRQPELALTPVNPAHFFGEVGPARVHVSVSVPAPGDQAYRAIVTDAETALPRDDVQKVFLELVPPASAGLTAERIELTASDDPLGGLYEANGAYTPVEGDWQMDVIVRRAGALDESVSFVLPVTTAGTPELRPPPDTGVGVPAPIAAAWSLLPAGLLGWLPAALALAAVVVLGRLRPSLARSVARGTAVTLLLVVTAGAGSRALVVAANAPTAGAMADLPPLPDDADPIRGEAIYRANCAGCHGLDLEGRGPMTTVPAAGPLVDVTRATSDAELSYRIAYGVAGTPMPAFAGLLTPDERADLIAYLRSRSGDE